MYKRKSHYYKIYKREKDDVSLDKFAAAVDPPSPLCRGLNPNGERDRYTGTGKYKNGNLSTRE